MLLESYQAIQQYFNLGNVAFKKHAFIRMVERKINVEEVEQAVSNCTVIESYPEDQPLPSYLLLGYTNTKRPLHILVGLDDRQKFI